jgi:hypothetical protein
MYTDLKFKSIIDLMVWMNDGLLTAWWTDVTTLIQDAISTKSIASPIIQGCIPCVAVSLISEFRRFFNQ